LVDDPAHLAAAADALARLPLPVVLAAHPRTSAALRTARICVAPHVHVVPPLGYFEAVAVARDAAVVVTDSGGLQREAYWLGTPCVTVRSETEWAETVALGANVLVNTDALEMLAPVVGRVVASTRLTWDRGMYGDGSAAARVATALRTL
ncbi:MAG TPA: UDP-N-acetylglucosamine 2-epimerase, partial [Gemmatirosa sp.]